MCSWTFRRNVSALRAVEETCVGPTSGVSVLGVLVEGPAEGRDHMPKAAKSLSLCHGSCFWHQASPFSLKGTFDLFSGKLKARTV